MTYIQKGTPQFRKTSLAMFAGGFCTFAILYCLQPLMPEFSKQFGVSPATASLSLSVTTVAMAVTMLFVSALSDAKGRKSIMGCSLGGAALIALLLTFSPSFGQLLALRILQGVVLAGLPAVAMTYLSEEVDPHSLGYAMGLYISGNSVGGMGGRIVTGMVADFFDWRLAVGAIAALSIGAVVLFWRWLPASRNFQKRKYELRGIVKALLSQCRNPRLLCLYGLGFVLMGCFVTLYNYISYRLIDPPFSLSQALVGWIFIVYLTGTISSTWMGRLADLYGRYAVMSIALLLILAGGLLTLSSSLLAIVVGISLLTFGFFGGHSIASSWIGIAATEHKAQASSLYLFFYYLGSSVSGTVGGIFYAHYGWSGVIAMIAVYMAVGLILSGALRHMGRNDRADHSSRMVG
ncbi:MFS transporter [Paenibacillus thailandensis]|uniref:MFS transporter n=1 Tax=Paenibacillus thailandensis TaxID=393250 RepID=A0ABW5QU18_9BACL